MTAEPDPDYDPAVYSGTSVADADSPTGWRRLTWAELAEDLMRQVAHLQGFHTIVSDLDRNPNGRHEGDADVGDQGGVSQGNPRFTTGDVVGYQLGGRPILMPPRERRHDPDAWLGR